ncbi:hypothetical protein SAMN04488000_109217 [Lentzea albida]|uniref:Uncharacterized protein n=1 Tax=Lentzea albida TaxID=65499 RepID=A0A1H9PQK8_9PSEU|nr:hypothetical protein SAMN04488000_109217 [Lentzea albida]
MRARGKRRACSSSRRCSTASPPRGICSSVNHDGPLAPRSSARRSECRRGRHRGDTLRRCQVRPVLQLVGTHPHPGETLAGHCHGRGDELPPGTAARVKGRSHRRRSWAASPSSPRRACEPLASGGRNCRWWEPTCVRALRPTRGGPRVPERRSPPLRARGCRSRRSVARERRATPCRRAAGAPTPRPEPCGGGSLRSPPSASRAGLPRQVAPGAPDLAGDDEVVRRQGERIREANWSIGSPMVSSGDRRAEVLPVTVTSSRPLIRPEPPRRPPVQAALT